MAKRGKIVALSTVAVSVVALLVGALAVKDRAREWWFIRRLESGKEDQENAAAVSLATVGTPNAIPALTKVIRKRRLRTNIRWNFMPDGRVSSCLMIPGSFGVKPRAVTTEPWVPADAEFQGNSLSAERLADLAVYRCFFGICERVGDRALPALSDALKDEDEYVRYLSVCILMRRGLFTKPTIALLMEALDDDVAPTQLSAVLGLSAFGPDAIEASAKIESLAASHSEEYLRSCAAEALKRIRGNEHAAQR